MGKYFCIASILVHRFKCECLKVAVLKNKWLAQHLGGKNWSNLNLLQILSKSFRRHVFRCFQVWSARGCGSGVEVTHVVRPYSCHCHSIVTTEQFKVVEINLISQQGKLQETIQPSRCGLKNTKLWWAMYEALHKQLEMQYSRFER